MDEKEFDYLNVIPLVDVMLVLLTIVLTTSTFIATGGIQVGERVFVVVCDGEASFPNVSAKEGLRIVLDCKPLWRGRYSKK